VSAAPSDREFEHPRTIARVGRRYGQTLDKESPRTAGPAKTTGPGAQRAAPSERLTGDARRRLELTRFRGWLWAGLLRSQPVSPLVLGRRHVVQ
jgi:hypothetical protein